MNLLDLYAKITLDTGDYYRGLDEANSSAFEFGEKLKSGFATAAKVTAAGIGAATTAVAAITKSAVAGYAEYEQLTGGVETLFKTSAGLVQQYAENAYKTAGMSANEYMDTVTSFSASLLKSLDGSTVQAAKKADQAITDMSDNANKMGTDISMIQNAYQGFAKQNYTMLDNLKLGYGGTQQEMARLLEDAEKISGIEYDMSSYADIVDAIHVIQTEMGITGTTAAEASKTISGSLGALKSAWENMVVGIGDENADLDALIADVVETATTFGENLIPRVDKILGGIGNAITKFSEEILPLVIEKFMEYLPEMISTGTELIVQLAVGFAEAIPEVIEAIPEIIDNIIEKLVEAWPQIAEAGKQIIRALYDGMKSAVDKLFSAHNQFMEETGATYSPGRSATTGAVDLSHSALGVTSAAMINTSKMGNVNLTANLVMPEGNAFAQYYLPSMINTASANGTPILNPDIG